MKKNLLKMKKLLLICAMALFSIAGQAQETIIKFKVQSKTELQKISELVSIDNFYDNTVVAYANADQLKAFKQTDYEFEVMPHPSVGKSLTMATTVAEMANWDRYPTHDVYLEMMQQMATDFPEICRLETIGTSEEGRSVQVLKITDNPDDEENEPEFFYTGQMHGDEIVSYIMLLRLADYILNNYEKEQRITDLINNVEIWINPVSNPDGTYASGDNTVSGATRSNSNGVDLNRNFPTPNDQNPTYQNEAEVQMMLTFAQNHNFVLSANIHSGIVLVNFPWDSWTSNVKTHADHTWWEQVSHNYADAVHEVNANYMTAYDNGVTHGGDWYVVDGSRQDNMCYFQNGREFTLELSSNKMLDSEDLPAHWSYNKNALIGYIEEALYGIRGLVIDSNEDPVDATITIPDHDADNSEVVSDPDFGDYHRMIDDGAWNLTYSASGHTDVTVDNITVVDEQITIVDVMFDGTQGTTTLTGTFTNKETGDPVEGAEVVITGQNDSYTVSTDASGNYSVENVIIGTYKLDVTKQGYMGAMYVEAVTTADSDISKTLVPTLYMEGVVTDAETGFAIEGAEVAIQDLSIDPATTNTEGEYSISGIMAGDYTVSVSAQGYGRVYEDITVSGTATTFNFTLNAVNAISFEDGVMPDGFTTTGDADWYIDDANGYDGTHSARSGAISDNQITTMEYTHNYAEATDISFALKTDCEDGSSYYDYLEFFIDGASQGKWKGSTAWTEVSFPVTAGEHTFSWTFERDGSVGSGENAVWVDFIILPGEPIEEPTASLSASSLTFNASPEAMTLADSLVIMNIGQGTLSYSTMMNDGNWTDITSTDVDLGAQESAYITVNVDASGMENGTYHDTLLVAADQAFEIPVILNVSGVGVADIENAKVSVYPNPANHHFTISATETIRSIEVYNATGQLVCIKKQIGSNTSTIAQEFESGIYFVKISSANATNTLKLIIE